MQAQHFPAAPFCNAIALHPFSLFPWGATCVMYINFILLPSLFHPLFRYPFLTLLYFPSPLLFYPFSPLLGEGLSSSRLSLHKPGSASSVSSLSQQRRESRVSVLLNHLLPSSSSNTGLSSGPSPHSTPQTTPSSFRRFHLSPSQTRCTGPGPQGIPEVVVSPPEDDEPAYSAEEDAVSPQLTRRTSSASQNHELLPLEGKYLCSLPVWVTAWTENTSTSMKALFPCFYIFQTCDHFINNPLQGC